MSKCTGTLRDELGGIRLSILKGKLEGKTNNLSPEETQQIIKENIDRQIKNLKSIYKESPNEDFYEDVDDILRKFGYKNIANYLNDSIGSEISNIGNSDDIIKAQYARSNIDLMKAEGVDITELDILKLDKLSDLSRIFNNNIDALNKFIEKFNADILDSVLIANADDENKITFASTNLDLNNNINAWKNSIEYNGKELDDKIIEEISKYSNSNDVSNALLSVKNTDLYKMFTKRNFDKLLKLTNNKLISTTGKLNKNYKFSIQSHMKTGWSNEEFVDFFDELGSFAKTILETRKSIKLINKNGKFVFDISDSFPALDKTFYSINKLYKLIDRTDPSNSFEKAIKTVLKEKLVNNTLNSFYNNITNDDLSIYLGLYYNFLEKDDNLLKNSKIKISQELNKLPNFYKASLNTFKINAYSDSLDYYDVIIANIVKQTGNNYTQTIYDYDTKEFKIETLNSAKVNKAKFQLKSNIEIRINNLDFNSLIENLNLGFDFNNNKPIVYYDNLKINLNNNSYSVNGELSDSTYDKIKEFVHSFIPYSASMNIDTFNDYLKASDDTKTSIEYLLPIAIRSAYLLKNKASEEVSIDSAIGIINLTDIQKGIAKYSEFINHETGGDVKSITMSANDTALPSYGLINMINEPNTMISFINKGIERVNQRNKSLKRKRPNIFEDNFLIKNNKDLLKANINTFIVSGENINPVHKSYTQDVFFNNFVMEYLGNINQDGYKLVIQPTTFSDKSKQSAVVFNALNTTSKWNNATILKALRENTTDYYNKSIEIVKLDLLDVLESFGYNFKTNPTLSEIENLFSSDDFKNKNISITDFYKRAQDLGIEIINQLHFEKDFKINSVLKMIEDYDSKVKQNKTFNEDDLLYNKLIDDQLNSFINQLSSEGIVIDMENSKKVFESYIGRVNKIGYKTYDDYSKDWIDKSTNRLIYKKNDKINPILERYYYERALIAESYQHITVGSELSHKSKGAKSIKDTNGDYVKALSSNMAMRYIAMTKRAVAHQATMHPYELGLFNGVPYYENVAFVEDPTMTLFNELGNNTDQDVTDGASFSNMLSTILKNNSLLDQGGQIHHKSIGMLIDPINGTAKLMKHADHNISNEKIRNSQFATYKLKSLVRKMLDKPFKYDIDLTKDFNNRNIFNGLSIRYKNQNGDVVKPKSMKKIGRNTYDIDGQDVEINSLYKLWEVLGAENSVNENDIFDDSSWYNLAEFVNRVGFYKNENDLSNFINENNLKYKNFRKEINRDRYNDDDGIEYKKDSYRPTANSIYQPLKNGFISQVTFVSAFKVGPSNINKVDVLEENDQQLNPTRWSSIYTGLQLDHEHHTDDSELTEPTQSIAALFFNGDAYQWNKQVSTAIKMYVKRNIAKFFKTDKLLQDIDVSDLQKEINDYISKELSKKDAIGFSINDNKRISQHINKLVSAKRNALKIKDKDKFDSINIDIDESVALSDSGIYNIIINSINNLFTSLGIRRKLSGSANVQSPQTNFITVHNIDGKIKLAGTLTNEDIEKINTEIDLTNNINEVQLFDVVDLYDETGLVYSNYHLTDFDIYDEIIKGKYTKVVKKPYGGRDLNPTMIRFKVGGNTRGFYNSDAGRLLIYANTYSKGINKTKFKDEESYLNAIQQRINDLNNLKDKYNLLMNRYNQSYDKDESGIDSIQQAFNNAIENPELGLYLNKKQKAVLKNLQLKTYEDIKNGIYYTNEFDEGFGFDIGTKVEITDYQEIPSEVIMPSHMKSKFLIEDGLDVNDISVEYYQEKINNLIADAVKNKNFKFTDILIEANKEHIYCMPEENLPIDAVLEENYSGEYENKNLLNSFNEKLSNIGSITFYSVKKNGKKYRIATYKNRGDINKIENLDDGKHRYVMTLTDNSDVNRLNIDNTSTNLFNNFQASLKGTFSRIPGQSKQSIMAFNIVGFLQSERNSTYTSPYFLWLAGAKMSKSRLGIK